MLPSIHHPPQKQQQQQTQQRQAMVHSAPCLPAAVRLDCHCSLRLAERRSVALTSNNTALLAASLRHHHATIPSRGTSVADPSPSRTYSSPSHRGTSPYRTIRFLHGGRASTTCHLQDKRQSPTWIRLARRSGVLMDRAKDFKDAPRTT
ncbi:unnamed protein product, partial [Scytosiphon promiscuus]